MPQEHVLFSDRYGFTISLLYFDDRIVGQAPEEAPEEDTYDRMISRNPGQPWLS